MSTSAPPLSLFLPYTFILCRSLFLSSLPLPIPLSLPLPLPLLILSPFSNNFTFKNTTLYSSYRLTHLIPPPLFLIPHSPNSPRARGERALITYTIEAVRDMSFEILRTEKDMATHKKYVVIHNIWILSCLFCRFSYRTVMIAPLFHTIILPVGCSTYSSLPLYWSTQSL